MLRKCSLVCGILALVALALPAAADPIPITVGFVPVNGVIPAPGGSIPVNIVANIPQNTAVVGWGLDLTIVNPAIAALVPPPVIGPPWVPVFAPDGDGLAGLAPTPPGTGIWGPAVVLATVTFTGLVPGVTPILLSDNNPTPPLDLTEGFAIDPLLGGGFAQVNYVGGTITVLPEPAAFSLLALTLVALRRR